MDVVAIMLEAADIPSARREARLLVAHVLGVETARIFGWPETPLDDAQRDRLAALARRRAGREPMAHLLGVREFWGLPFTVNAAVLVPRPETETLIEAVLEAFPDRSRTFSVLDLGTGSGCLLLAVLSEFPNAEGVGVDRSAEALVVAAGNARALGLGARARFIEGDWGSGLDRRFDVVLANPPYIASGEIATLAPEVARFEPLSALDGGGDGLDAYRCIAADLGRLLAASGRVFLEVGQGQAGAVANLLKTAGFRTATKRDLLGVERCVVAAQGENFVIS